MHNKKTLSCKYIHHSVYLAPNELRHCCKRFYVNGKMKGDVKIFPVKNTSDINSKKILKAKKKLYDEINKNKKTPCSGCPYLFKDHWPNFNKLEVKHISIESHSVCNMKCTYCSDTYYGGKKSNYNLHSVLKEMNKSKSLSKKIDISWGGGEPLLLDNFDQTFEFVTENLKPASTMVYTNATKYSKTLEKYLINGKIKITTSIDAGTLKTFKKIRGVKIFKKVLQNLEKYFFKANKGIIIKYILTKENFQESELKAFLNKMKEYNLGRCEFQISSDFTNEKLSKKQVLSALNLYFSLKKLGTKNCFFDYHLRPRVQQVIKKFIVNNDYEFKKFITNNRFNHIKFEKIKKIIIWGAGDTGRNIINDSYILKKYNIKIDFFVDKDPGLQNKKINNINILKPSLVLNSNSQIIIASTNFYEEIKKNLISMGVKDKRVLDGIYF